MFFFIEGIIESKTEETATINCNGLGFKLSFSKHGLKELPEIGNKIRIYTIFYLKENQPFQGFGFLSISELKLFETLISVSGIGPKMSLSILSQNTPEEIIWAISQEKPEFLERISGIGKKTAQRIILELKDKIILPKEKENDVNFDQDIEIIDALASLGFNKKNIIDVLRSIRNEKLTLEEKFKKALVMLNKKKK